jgi:FkbM family methyltransferase
MTQTPAAITEAVLSPAFEAEAVPSPQVVPGAVLAPPAVPEAPARSYADFHPILARFPPWSGEAPHIFRATSAGSWIRKSFVEPYADNSEGAPYFHGQRFPAVNEEFFEWIDLYESVDCARDSFCMVEAGAGYGRWLVAAACAVRRHRPMPMKLVGIEAEGTHFKMMEQHFRDNGLDPDEHRLIEAACNGDGRDVFFAVGAPVEWYGQAIVGEGFKMSQFPEARSVRTKAVTLQEVLAPLSHVDLLDMDVQGVEAEIVEAAIVPMSQKVKRVHIGTHGHDLEERLRLQFRQAGWRCCNDFPCQTTIETHYGKVNFGDGVQSWINPNLA